VLASTLAPVASARRAGGFSLLELLSVLVIVAVLGAVAYPGYQRHLASARRTIAAACLLEHAQAMERHYAVRQSYLEAPEPLPCQDVSRFYQIAFAAALLPDAYVLQAEPQGAQADSDAHCGTLSINQWGVRMVSVEGTDPMQCW